MREVSDPNVTFAGEIGPSMDRRTEILTEIGWLSTQSYEFQQWIVDAGSWRRFNRNTEIYAAGEPAEALIGVAEGALDIIFMAQDHKSVILSREGRGFWIGDLAMLAQKARLVSVYAATPTDVFFVRTQTIMAKLQETPEYWHAFYQLSYENLENALVLWSEALALPVTARLARRLRHLADGNLTVHISQQALADLLSTTRTHVQRSLAALAQQGLIETGYNEIRIIDLQGLMAAGAARP